MSASPVGSGAVLSLLQKETHPGLDWSELQADSSYGGGARCLLKLIGYRKAGHRLLEEYRRSKRALSSVMSALRRFTPPWLIHRTCEGAKALGGIAMVKGQE